MSEFLRKVGNALGIQSCEREPIRQPLPDLTGYTLVRADEMRIKREWDALPENANAIHWGPETRPLGFCHYDAGELWVRFDGLSELPDFETLGHEVWHALVGNFHP